MAVKVLMPKGSDTMTEGKVLKWLKKEGDPVSTGETVVEIETDKVDMEVEAMGGGVLRKILIDAGRVVPVGELLAVIAKEAEDISPLLKGESPASRAAGEQPAAEIPVPAPVPAGARGSASGCRRRGGGARSAVPRRSLKSPQMADAFWPRLWRGGWLRKWVLM